MKTTHIQHILSNLKKINTTQLISQLDSHSKIKNSIKQNPKEKNSHSISITLNNRFGGIFEGETLSKNPSGIGYLFSLKGFEYFGEFLNGKRHGKGEFRTTKFKILGEHDQDFVNGVVKITLDNGTIFKGRVTKEGKVEKFMELNIPENNILIIGDLGDKDPSNIIQILKKGEVYIGQINEKNFKHGIGACIKSNVSYKGVWTENNFHNFGVLLKENEGYLYIGEFYEGEREGVGKEIDEVKKTLYLGGFSENEKHGFGMIEEEFGIYYGFWKNGLKHGEGLFMFNDASYYLGFWRKGKRSGKGIYVKSSNGKVFKAEWKNGKIDGRCYIRKKGSNSGKIYFYDDGIPKRKIKGVSKKRFIADFDEFDLVKFYTAAKKRMEKMVEELSTLKVKYMNDLIEIKINFNKKILSLFKEIKDIESTMKNMSELHDNHLTQLYEDCKEKDIIFQTEKDLLMNSVLIYELDEFEDKVKKRKNEVLNKSGKIRLKKLDDFIMTEDETMFIDVDKFISQKLIHKDDVKEKLKISPKKKYKSISSKKKLKEDDYAGSPVHKRERELYKRKKKKERVSVEKKKKKKNTVNLTFKKKKEVIPEEENEERAVKRIRKYGKKKLIEEDHKLIREGSLRRNKNNSKKNIELKDKEIVNKEKLDEMWKISKKIKAEKEEIWQEEDKKFEEEQQLQKEREERLKREREEVLKNEKMIEEILNVELTLKKKRERGSASPGQKLAFGLINATRRRLKGEEIPIFIKDEENVEEEVIEPEEEEEDAKEEEEESGNKDTKRSLTKSELMNLDVHKLESAVRFEDEEEEEEVGDDVPSDDLGEKDDNLEDKEEIILPRDFVGFEKFNQEELFKENLPDSKIDVLKFENGDLKGMEFLGYHLSSRSLYITFERIIYKFNFDEKKKKLIKVSELEEGNQNFKKKIR